MGYWLEGGEALGDGVRRVAAERLDDALSLLDHPGSPEDIEEAVYDVRKRCKELRGLIRLVRPALGDRYATTNATLRDAARELSPLRDAHALLATFDAVVAANLPRVGPEGFSGVRAGLAAAADQATAAVDGGDPRLATARALLAAVADGVRRWDVGDDVDVVAEGMTKTYGRGRKAMRAAREEGTDDALHDWRKRVKYLWYEVRLVQSSAPSVLGPLVERLHDLADGLGDDHDLAVLVATTAADPEAYGGKVEVERLHHLLDDVRADLQDRCLRLGARLLAERPEAFARRIAAYLEAWREVGDERPVGEIADLAGADDELSAMGDDDVVLLASTVGLDDAGDADRGELEAALRATGVVRP